MAEVNPGDERVGEISSEDRLFRKRVRILHGRLAWNNLAVADEVFHYGSKSSREHNSCRHILIVDVLNCSTRE